MKKIALLKTIIKDIETYLDRPSDPFASGRNSGLETAICIIEEKIKQIEELER